MLLTEMAAQGYRLSNISKRQQVEHCLGCTATCSQSQLLERAETQSMSWLAERMTQAWLMYFRDCRPAAPVLSCTISGIRVSFLTHGVVCAAPPDDCWISCAAQPRHSAVCCQINCCNVTSALRAVFVQLKYKCRACL